jgi:peptidoglycan/xylan/chitin deacetylase (PgdA/CDA1 family)
MRIPGWKTVRQSGRWLRSRLMPGALILGYHRVADLQSDPHGLAVSVHHFAEQVEVLSRLAHPMSLAQLVAHVKAGTVPPQAVALTFDDGYADVLYQALPLLERYQIPATVFVVSGCLGEPFWWERGQSVQPGDPFPPRAMTRAELLQLADSRLVDFGAHTVTHPVLAERPLYEQRMEIEQSKAELEAILGRAISAFSYPHGAVSAETRQLVQQAGYDYACSSTPDVARSANHPFCLPRFWIGDWDGRRFEQWLRRWLPGVTTAVSDLEQVRQQPGR